MESADKKVRTFLGTTFRVLKPHSKCWLALTRSSPLLVWVHNIENTSNMGPMHINRNLVSNRISAGSQARRRRDLEAGVPRGEWARRGRGEARGPRAGCYQRRRRGSRRRV